MSNSNIQSLVFYNALLADAEKSLNDIIADPTLPGHLSLVNQFTELVKSHKNNIARLDKQIENPAEAKSDAEKVLEFLTNLYEISKHFIPADAKKWIEALIEAAKKVIKHFTK